VVRVPGTDEGRAAGSSIWTIQRGAAVSANVRERLADVQHEIWAHWMRYMFTCGQFGPDGTWHMPAFKAERWQRQMDTPYSALTEQERESDREQADKVILKIRHLLEGATLAEVYGPRLEAAELELSHLRPEWQAVTAERDAAVKRAEAAEAALATAGERIKALAERLGIYST